MVVCVCSLCVCVCGVTQRYYSFGGEGDRVTDKEDVVHFHNE